MGKPSRVDGGSLEAGSLKQGLETMIGRHGRRLELFGTVTRRQEREAVTWKEAQMDRAASDGNQETGKTN